jgi:hypothetical protein
MAASRRSLRLSWAGKGAVRGRVRVRIRTLSDERGKVRAMWAGIVACGLGVSALNLAFDIQVPILVSFESCSGAASSSYAVNFNPDGGKSFTGKPW